MVGREVRHRTRVRHKLLRFLVMKRRVVGSTLSLICLGTSMILIFLARDPASRAMLIALAVVFFAMGSLFLLWVSRKSSDK